MKVSFEGIGQWCATFMGDVQEGHVVKVDGAGAAAECQAGDAFCGAAVWARKDACTVQMGGFARLRYSGAAPALGYTALCADGKGGVQSAGGQSGGGTEEAQSAGGTEGAQGGGRSYWIVDVDESDGTVTVLL